MSYTLDEQIKCVVREVGMRERVYPSWVAKGKITQKKADYEIACLKSVIRVLESQQPGLPDYGPENKAWLSEEHVGGSL